MVIADASHAGLDARAYSWGDPNDSRLGGVDTRLHHSPQLVKMLNHTLKRLRLNIAKAAQHPKNSIVACGIAHTLVLTSTGQLLAWGCGKYGQLGYGDLWDREEPVVVPGVYSVLAFATGNRHNIAVQRAAEAHLAKSEIVYAWGSNAFGELGLGDKNVRLQPAALCTLNKSIKDCAAGARHSLVLARALSTCPMDAPRNEISIDGDSAEISLFHFDVLRNKFKDGRQSHVLPGLRYCLDTLPADQSASVRFTYESVLRCFPCRQSYVCRSCARRCHASHNVEAKFIRWMPSCDRCGCAESGSCSAAWSWERSIFDNFVTQTTASPHKCVTDGVLDMRLFKELLQAIHPEGLSEDAIDSGEVALHSRVGTITWAAFQKWHNPYFEDVRRAAEVDQT